MMVSDVRRGWTIALGIYAAAVVAIVVAADANAMADWVKDLVWKTPYGDKAAHFLLVGGLAGLAVRASRGHRWRFGLPTAAVIVFALATCEEVSQRWIPARTADVSDFLANTSGIVVFGWLATLGSVKARRTPPAPPAG